jgi:hypothetical protein
VGFEVFTVVVMLQYEYMYSVESEATFCLLHVCLFFFFLNPEDVGATLVQKVG